MSTFEEAVQDIKKAKSVLEEKSEKAEVDYQHPDPVKHKYISFAKSAVRIAAGVALCYSMFWYAGGLLILAEVLGIVEEMV